MEAEPTPSLLGPCVHAGTCRTGNLFAALTVVIAESESSLMTICGTVYDQCLCKLHDLFSSFVAHFAEVASSVLTRRDMKANTVRMLDRGWPWRVADASVTAVRIPVNAVKQPPKSRSSLWIGSRGLLRALTNLCPFILLPRWSIICSSETLARMILERSRESRSMVVIVNAWALLDQARVGKLHACISALTWT